VAPSATLATNLVFARTADDFFCFWNVTLVFFWQATFAKILRVTGNEMTAISSLSTNCST